MPNYTPILLTLSATIAYAALPGTTICHYQSLDHLDATGLVTMDHCHVHGLVRIQGSLQAKDSQITHLQLNGQSVLTNVTIDQANLTGSLQAQSSRFNDIHLISQHASFTQCHLNNLAISHSQPALVILKNAQIAGTLKFTQYPGQVLADNSQINQLINGQFIQNKESTCTTA